MSQTLSKEKEKWIRERVAALSSRELPQRLVVYSDTTGYMSIERDQLIFLDGEYYLVRCNEHELRFGMSDQPKFWVKRSLCLESGDFKILKCVIREEFKARLAGIEIRCYRSEEKESRVLELVRGDNRFMQGRSVTDSCGNLVRIIDFIHGPHLLDYLYRTDGDHRQYFEEYLPSILAKFLRSVRGIERLHQAGLCHGDIRTDHLIVDQRTDDFVWIDFDLAQDVPDYDLWSIGNVLHSIVGRGLVTFHGVLKKYPELKNSLENDDGSLFFPHRIMNLRKVFPYIPASLNQILMRFSIGTTDFYENVSEIAHDLDEVISAM